jgi:hypothetical protein
LFYVRKVCVWEQPRCYKKLITIKKLKIMKKILLLLLGWSLLAASCASSTVGSKQSQSAVAPLVYYTDNDEPTVVGVFRYSEQEAP